MRVTRAVSSPGLKRLMMLDCRRLRWSSVWEACCDAPERPCAVPRHMGKAGSHGDDRCLGLGRRRRHVEAVAPFGRNSIAGSFGASQPFGIKSVRRRDVEDDERCMVIGDRRLVAGDSSGREGPAPGGGWSSPLTDKLRLPGFSTHSGECPVIRERTPGELRIAGKQQGELWDNVGVSQVLRLTRGSTSLTCCH